MVYLGDLNDAGPSHRKSLKSTYSKYKKWILGGVGALVATIIIIIIVASTSGDSNTEETQNKSSDSKPKFMLVTGGVNKPNLGASIGNIEKYEDAKAGTAPKLGESFKYGTNKIRGVNLGGWLVTEPFITPSLFKLDNGQTAPDEWTLCKELGPERCVAKLKTHYETFITEDDIKKLANQGINHVRIPIGYWAIEVMPDDPYVYGSWDYLLKGIQWCRKYGLRVMIDFHAVQGSQNGFASSGHEGIMSHRNMSVSVDTRRTVHYAYRRTVQEASKFFFTGSNYRNVVTMINLVDNPLFAKDKTSYNGISMYHDAYKNVRDTAGSEEYPLLSFHDFEVHTHWQGILNTKVFKNCVLDYRNRLVTDDPDMSPENKAIKVCQTWKARLAFDKFHPPLINGAFSLAFNDCGKYINGVTKGNLYDGSMGSSRSGDCADFTDVDKLEKIKDAIKKHAQYQISTYEMTDSYGWFFWTLKMEGKQNPLWNYEVAVEKGWFPTSFDKLEHTCPT